MPSRVARAEHFFISSLEEWRKSVGVEKMILVGHSLGGYLASAYTVRYPERVSGLILVSPAGIPRGPDYKRFPTTAEIESAGGLNAIDAAEMAAEGAVPAPKAEPVGEAKKWQQDRETSAFRRNMGKCRSFCSLYWAKLINSLCMGMGEGMVSIHFLEVDGALGTHDGRQVLCQAIRRTIRRGCEGSTFLYLEYERHEG
jgi:pimeloyl-ACP methyl ester carboxylesterase